MRPFIRFAPVAMLLAGVALGGPVSATHQGTIYVLQEDATLNVIEGTGVAGYGSALWPRYRRDNGGSGSLQQGRVVAELPPLYVFYAIHVHAAGDHLPYDSPALRTLDPEVAQNMLAAIEGIAHALETYGAKGTWEVVYGTAQGLCAFEGEDHIFRRLVERGHEVGLHVHRYADYERDLGALRDACGITPTVTSGLITDARHAGPSQFQQVMSEGIARQLGWGIHAATINLSVPPIFNWCQGVLGIGNDMGDVTGNLMFPWRPDYKNQNICADDPDGDFVFVDHSPMPWWTTSDGREVVDVLTDANFERLQALFDAALQYMEEHRPERVAAWGFVTHIHEYAVGNKGENPPSPEALAALERFLAYVAEKAAEGRVIFATAGEIARAAFPVPGSGTEP